MLEKLLSLITSIISPIFSLLGITIFDISVSKKFRKKEIGQNNKLKSHNAIQIIGIGGLVLFLIFTLFAIKYETIKK